MQPVLETSRLTCIMYTTNCDCATSLCEVRFRSLHTHAGISDHVYFRAHLSVPGGSGGAKRASFSRGANANANQSRGGEARRLEPAYIPIPARRAPPRSPTAQPPVDSRGSHRAPRFWQWKTGLDQADASPAKAAAGAEAADKRISRAAAD